MSNLDFHMHTWAFMPAHTHKYIHAHHTYTHTHNSSCSIDYWFQQMSLFSLSFEESCFQKFCRIQCLNGT